MRKRLASASGRPIRRASFFACIAWYAGIQRSHFLLHHVADAARTDAADSLFDFHQWGIATNKPQFNGEWVPISQVYDLQMGKTPSRDIPEYWNNGEHDWVSIKDLGSYEKYVGKTSETISELGRVKSGIKSVPANTLLMSFKLSLGKTAITTKETYTNEAIMAFLDQGTYDVDIDYMWHQLQSKDWTVGTNTAVMGKTLNKKTLSATKIRVPSISEQKEIAKHLDVVQETLSLLSLELKTLDDLVKSRFVEMFGDATSIASKWNQIPFGECLAVFESGNSPSCSNAPREGDNPAVLKLSALSSGRFIAGENKAMLEGEDINPDKEVKRGDILIARKNTPELVGSCAIVRDEVKNLMFPDIVFRVHPRDNVSGEYLCELLSGPSFSGKLKSLAHGSAKSMSNISKTALERLPVPLPPLSLQQQFADFVARVDKLGFKQSLCYRATVSTSMQGVMQYYPQAIP